MKRIKFICLFTVLCFFAQRAQSQSMSTVKYYLGQENYTDAAKALRPLADGGNAEAQLLAAKLFFEGKGVMQSDDQGINYATMAANQGNVESIELLVNHYYRTNNPKTYATAKKYSDKYPELNKGNIGLIMAKCLRDGMCETPINETLGWNLFENNDSFETFLNDMEFAGRYWSFKAKSNNKESVEELAEYLYQTGKKDDYKKVESYLNRLYDTIESLEEKAKSGNVWAMSQLALQYYNGNQKLLAMEWAQKASSSGSRMGSDMVDRINYKPITCTNIRVGRQKSQYTTISSIVLEYDRMTINYSFYNSGYLAWIAVAQDMSLRYNGKIYKMISSTLPILPQRRNVSINERFVYSVTYERIPLTASTFDIFEDGSLFASDVQIMDYPVNGGVVKPVKQDVSINTESNSKVYSTSGVTNDSVDLSVLRYYYASSRKHLRTMGIIDKKDNLLSSGEIKVKRYGDTIGKTAKAKIQLFSKKYKILTPHPEGSYSFERMAYRNYLVLVVTDPEKFWSQSDMAVILTY